MWWLKKWLCGPRLKWLGITLAAIGLLLLIIFVPIQFWLALLGVLLIVLGVLIII